jgi:hypothetical protein
MPRKESKLRPDVNEIAFRTAKAATGQGKKPIPVEKAERRRKPARQRSGKRH